MSKQATKETAPAWFYNSKTGEAKLFNDHKIGAPAPKGFCDSPAKVKANDAESRSADK